MSIGIFLIIYGIIALATTILIVLAMRVGYWDDFEDEIDAIPFGIFWPLVLGVFLIRWVVLAVSKWIDKWADNIKKLEKKDELPTWKMIDSNNIKEDSHGVIDHTRMSVKVTGTIRRGPEEYRKRSIFQKSEIVFTTDSRKIYIGDGVTIGGLYVGDIPEVVEGDVHMYSYEK